jgi:leucyl/phenylalanyl-tRNA--protein transferase
MVFRLNKELIFPDPALSEEDGLLAIGGDLSLERLLLAYRNGIFPWPSEGQPLVWYSPPERFVLFPEKFRISSSMRKLVKQNTFQVTVNQAFPEVIAACASVKRHKQRGTWITEAMQKAYIELHSHHHAFSVETWQRDELVGGIYGVRIGNVFCGESMFSRKSNASKAALISLVQSHSFRLIDCQVHSSHMETLGAEMISRQEYLTILAQAK